MNICFYHHHGINPLTGGIKRMTAALGDELASHGHKVVYLGRESDANDVFDKTRQYFLSALEGNSKDAVLENFLKNQRIDVFVFQDGDDGEIFSAEIFSRLGIPIVCCVHNDPMLWKNLVYAKILRRPCGRVFSIAFPWFIALKTFLKGRKYIRIFRKNSRTADATVLLSERFVPEYSRLISAADKRKISAFPNPIPFFPQQTELSTKRRELLFVGRMDNRQKCMDFLLAAWAKLETRFPDWRLRFVGDGRGLSPLRALSEKLKLRRVFFEGRQSPEPYYRDASIFCMTSAFEGFPMVLLEAAAFGCVPVAFDSFAAVRDIIDDGENGALVPAFDLDAYAETLARLMSDDALRERLAENALAQIPEKFSPEKIGAQWEALFRKLLAEKGRE